MDDFKENEALVLGKYKPFDDDHDDDYNDNDNDDYDDNDESLNHWIIDDGDYDGNDNDDAYDDAEMSEFEATFGCWRSSGPATAPAAKLIWFKLKFNNHDDDDEEGGGDDDENDYDYNPISDEKLHCHICSRNFSSRWGFL